VVETRVEANERLQVARTKWMEIGRAAHQTHEAENIQRDL
jgi:hypothetical protein